MTKLTDADIARAASSINVEVAALRAVIEVEALGSGFLADGRPVILYEAHVFHRETGGRHAGAKDHRGVALSVPNWDRSLYGPTGDNQWRRLEAAARLNSDAAQRSCSWGIGQVMGFNHRIAGHPTLAGFVDAMKQSEGRQLDAMVAFIKENKLDVPLRATPKNWAAFARGYNGAGYAANQYDTKLAAAYRKWSANPNAGSTPTLRRGSSGDAVRRLQQLLGGIGVDGSFGPLTEAAVKSFQQTKGLTADGIVGPRTWAALDT